MKTIQFYSHGPKIKSSLDDELSYLNHNITMRQEIITIAFIRCLIMKLTIIIEAKYSMHDEIIKVKLKLQCLMEK